MRSRSHVIPATALTICVGLLAACSGETTPAASPAPSASQAVDPCVAFVADLTPRQRLAQLLTVGVTGTADAVDVMRTEQVGGIFIGSFTDPATLANGEVDQIDAASDVPPMVVIDEEGGRVTRVADLIGGAPSARALARTMTVDQVREAGLERGRGLSGLGITVDLAPVVDVTGEPDGAAIGDRSYSDDPQTVAEYAGAYAEGLREAGVQPVLKHFPGHGSASGDSHTGTVTTPPLDQLIESDLVPFAALTKTDVGVMLGHLEVPGLTAPEEPTTISPEAIALLRDGTGYGAEPFDGPIFTDDLSQMRAITDRLGLVDAVEAALVAGADVALWLTTDQVPAVLDNLEDAVADGRLPAEQADASAARVARYKGAC